MQENNASRIKKKRLTYIQLVLLPSRELCHIPRDRRRVNILSVSRDENVGRDTRLCRGPAARKGQCDRGSSVALVASLRDRVSLGDGGHGRRV